MVVRDDVLGRSNSSKMAVMISSCVLGQYKRCYKNRQLRASLLNWVSGAAGVGGGGVDGFWASPFARCTPKAGRHHR